MGGSNSKLVNYGVYIGEKKDGETRIIRNAEIGDKDLMLTPAEGVDTIHTAFEYACKNFPEKPFLGTRPITGKSEDGKKNVYGDYRWKSYKEVQSNVKNFSSALVNLELVPTVKSESDGEFKFLGIYAKNREEWIVADLACHAQSVTCVTFYDTLGDDTIGFVLNQTKLTTIVMESKNLPKINKIVKENKHGDLANIILLDVEKEEIVKETIELGIKIHYYPDILSNGEKTPVEFNPSKPESIATFCYTSGTTGNPKGAMISHRGIISDCSALQTTSVSIKQTDRHLSYLPLAHVMERVFFTACMLSNVACGFNTGLPADLINDAKNLKPTLFLGVPRIFHRVIEAIKGKVDKLGYLKKSMAERAIKTKLANVESNGQLTHSIWDRLVFKNMKDSLGGEVRLLMTGSAPLDKQAQNFLKICFSCPVLEGYGATETCAASTITAIDDFKGGCVGGPIGACEIKLVDVPAMNYLSTNIDENGKLSPGGEICIRGNSTFSGYFNEKEKTKEAIDDDGWYHTGDIGIILPNMGLKIVDRVKNLFKLSHGEYVSPEKLENTLLNHPLISQIFIHGESLESFVVAIIVPNLDTVITMLTTLGIETKENVESYLADEKLVADSIKQLDAYGRKNGFKGFEVIKKLTFTKDAFSLENGLLTPSMKLKRFEAKNVFKAEIEKMYKK